jgi:dipeptidyl aminopeptidase/acylaminoacyl peptidase
LRREQIPSGEADRISAVVSSGRSTFVVSETVTTPQEIFEYTSEDPTMRVLTDLNPQLRFLRLATAKTIHWQVNGEYEAAGLLFLPPDYVQGKRYPLVIQTKGEQGWFACDSGSSHLPSFAPQPIATAGIAYLAPSSDGTQSSSDKPHGPNTAYPGGVGEAVQQMEMWDSAVDSLARLGIVDPTRVGIIGFSRTGFHVEFDITQAKTHYAAATAADNINYSLAEYLFLPYTSHAEIAMFGGPPFGDTLGNWERYSISYNLDRVHTPLLMEQMGYGVCDDDPNKIPLGLVTPYEIYRGLRLREKPVEMYYYPEDVHQPDHPLARLASLQRNVDWYRFWLQNYEDPLPSKQEQYKRWREMRRVFSLNR